jgi:hypothetical protein
MAGRGGMPRRDFTPAGGVSTEEDASRVLANVPDGLGCQPFYALFEGFRRIATGVFICILNRVRLLRSYLLNLWSF